MNQGEPEKKKSTLYPKIYQVVREIPPGRVATYGQVAAIVGSGSARTVGYAMAALRREDVPWQRVLNSQGRISERADGGEDSHQRQLLIAEGVLFDRLGRVDFERVGWEGPDMGWLDDNGFFPAPRPRSRR